MQEDKSKEVKLHSYYTGIKTTKPRRIAEGYPDGRWVGQMERLDYDKIFDELTCGDPTRASYRAVAKLYETTAEVVSHFINLPYYRERTEFLKELRADLLDQDLMEALSHVPESNPEAKNQELRMKHTQFMMERLNRKKYGKQVEVTNVNIELTAEDRAKRLAELQAKLLGGAPQANTDEH